MTSITKDTSVASILAQCPSARRIFDRYGLNGCGAGSGPAEPIEFFAAVHQVDLTALLRELNNELQNPSSENLKYREQLSDSLYRRFFKAGVAVVLSIGCFWGAVNLLEIGLTGSFLQVGMLPSIYAHANAMIYGFVLMFVMGFAYQAVPRFKNTVLQGPQLANLSFYLLAGGIVVRVVAELAAPGAAAWWLGAVSGGGQIAAVFLFLTVLRRTGAQSSSPSSPHEKFLAAAFLWLVAGTLLNEVFFFARLAAGTERELIRRIALVGGPLRDIQLLGFAGFIIAGISQRLVPSVYGLKAPRKDRSRQIFCLMNVSLVLNIASYLLLYSTHRPVFAIGLQLAYVLMPVWAILLALQIGIFSRPRRPDRTFKFVRAAYLWLMVSMLMMPFFLLYGRWTQQTFAHSYMGSHRHAFTVGFITLMIVGISSKVAPILAGLSASSLSSFWGPFLLLNIGNAARVTFQVLTDFAPEFAYSVVGFTGFIEVVGLAWWGTHLWRILSKRTVAPLRHGALISPVPAALVR